MIHDIPTTKEAPKIISINLDPPKRHLCGVFLYFVFIKLAFFKLF